MQILSSSMFLSIWSDITSWISTVATALLSLIPKVMYLLCSFGMSVLDVLQLLFRKLAGLDTYYIQTADGIKGQSGDMFYTLVRRILVEDNVLNDIFWGMVVIGLVLLFAASLIAIIRNQFMAEGDAEPAKKATSKKIVNTMFKAILSFVVLPTTCIFGAYLAGYLVNAIEGATNPSVAMNEKITQAVAPSTIGGVYAIGSDADLDDETRSILAEGSVDPTDKKATYINYDIFGLFTVGTKYTPFSGVIFRSSAAKCNRVRKDGDFFNTVRYNSQVNFGLFTGDTVEETACLIDDAFANCYRLKEDYHALLYADIQYGGKKIINDVLGNMDITSLTYAVPVTAFSKYNVGMVWYYYDLWQFDFIICIISWVVMLLVFFRICLGLVKRLFQLAVLTCIAPAICGIMPLDDGGAVKQWRSSYVEQVVCAFSAVGVINILYVFLGEFASFKFFGIGIVDYVIYDLFVIACLTAVEDVIAAISKMIYGGDGATKTGSGMAEGFKGNVSKVMDKGKALVSAGAKVGSALSAPLAAMTKGATRVDNKLKSKKADKIVGAANKDFKDMSRATKKAADKNIGSRLTDPSVLKERDAARLSAQQQAENDYDRYEQLKSDMTLRPGSAGFEEREQLEKRFGTMTKTQASMTAGEEADKAAYADIEKRITSEEYAKAGLQNDGKGGWELNDDAAKASGVKKMTDDDRAAVLEQIKHRKYRKAYKNNSSYLDVASTKAADEKKSQDRKARIQKGSENIGLTGEGGVMAVATDAFGDIKKTFSQKPDTAKDSLKQQKSESKKADERAGKTEKRLDSIESLLKRLVEKRDS